MDIEDIGATRMLWQCSRCGKWSVAKRRPVEHQRYVLRDDIRPDDTLVDVLDSFYTETQSKVLVWCGPFIAFQAAPIPVHNDQHYQTQWDNNQQRRLNSQRIQAASAPANTSRGTFGQGAALRFYDHHSRSEVSEDGSQRISDEQRARQAANNARSQSHLAHLRYDLDSRRILDHFPTDASQLPAATSPTTETGNIIPF